MTYPLAVLVAALPLTASRAVAEPVRALRPRPEQQRVVADLIQNLEHRDYAVRCSATRELKHLGKAAIPALTRAAQNAGPETAVRAVSVLERLYSDLNANESTVDGAETALEALRDSKSPVASRASSRALTGHAGLRRTRAIRAITRLGGIVEFMPAPFQQPAFTQPGSVRQINFVLIGKKWRGGDTGLKYVKRLSQLRNVYVTQSRKFQPVSKQALDGLQRDMPNISIQKRGLACLGVSGSINGGPGGCYVTLVKPKSAAARAAVRPGDSIIEFGGKKIRDFKSLVDGISDHEPGDKVDVTILRGGRRISVKVELTEWKR